MKIVNKIIKGIAYIAVYIWVFFGLYLFALGITASVSGIIIGCFSLLKHSIPYLIQRYTGLIELLVAVPVTAIMYIISLVKANKQSKAILESMKKKEE